MPESQTGAAQKEHMMDLVRRCERGLVIYQERFGASWLSNVKELEVTDKSFSLKLEPLRRVDTALWKDYKASAPITVRAPWNWVKGGKHVITALRYVRFCITFDPVIVEQVKALISLPKHPHGDVLSLLRSAQVEESMEALRSRKSVDASWPLRPSLLEP